MWTFYSIIILRNKEKPNEKSALETHTDILALHIGHALMWVLMYILNKIKEFMSKAAIPK